MSSIKTRINKLLHRRGPRTGGVVAVLSDGGYRYQGRTYGPDELPPGGYLFVPETMDPDLWNVEALEVHEGQKELMANH